MAARRRARVCGGLVAAVLVLAAGAKAIAGAAVTRNRRVVGTTSGFVEGFSFGRAAVRAHYTTSWTGDRYGWQARPTGVYASENGGRSWRLILAGTPLASLRLSRTSGIASIASGPDRCMCATRQFFTTNDGASWHPTSVAWPTLTVVGTDYVANPVRSATWVSDDGGTMWTTATSAPT